AGCPAAPALHGAPTAGTRACRRRIPRAQDGHRARPLVKHVVRLLATLGPVGYSPVAPATACSALVVFAGYFIPAPPLSITLLLLVVGAWLAVGICGAAERQLGHDAKPIVADEVVGQCLALLFVPRDPIAF